MVGALFLCTRCATIRTTSRTDDRPIREYDAQKVEQGWKYEAKLRVERAAEWTNPSEIAVDAAITRFKPCEVGRHRVVDRTVTTERTWDPNAENNRSVLYFWGAVGLVGAAVGGVVVATADPPSEPAGGGEKSEDARPIGWGLLGVGSLLAAAPLLNEFRAIDSTNHVGQVDEVRGRTPSKCDEAPARAVVVRIRARSAAQEVLAQETTNADGRAVLLVPTARIAELGPEFIVDVDGAHAGTTTELAFAFNAIRQDDREWGATPASECEIQASEQACAAVEAYLARFPHGRHRSRGEEILAKAGPRLDERRAARQREVRDASIRTDVSGVEISRVRVRIEDPSIGGTSRNRAVLAHADVTVAKPIAARPRLSVGARAVCDVGGRRMVDSYSALDVDLAQLRPGETKDTEFILFWNTPLRASPSACEITFELGELGGRETFPLRTVCWTPGALARGACSW